MQGISRAFKFPILHVFDQTNMEARFRHQKKEEKKKSIHNSKFHVIFFEISTY